jgi:hypothetical protein
MTAGSRIFIWHHRDRLVVVDRSNDCDLDCDR